MSAKDDGIDVTEPPVMHCGNCGSAHDGDCVTMRGVIGEVLRREGT